MNDIRLLAGLLLTSIGLHAQSGRAELLGTVQDAAGLAIAEAEVTVAELATNARYATKADGRGAYHLLGLPGGRYILTVEHAGFRQYQQSGVTLRAGDRSEVNVSLEVGAANQSLEVNAAAPLLQTNSGDVSFHLEEWRIATLPLDGRSFIPLIALSPGVALPGGGSLLPRINGSRPRTNEYMYDGISALQPEPGQVAFYPIIDGIQEFRLEINSYSPEYGRSNGGAAIVVLKSGSNELHGDVFEFFRNEALNARNYFAPAGPKPEFAPEGGPIC